MNLVSVAFITEFDDIVREGCHGPVVGTDDTFIVVGKHLATHLGEEAHLGRKLHPGFVEVETSAAILSPHALMPCRHLCRDVGTFVANGEACPSHEKLCAVVVCAVLVCRIAQSAEAHLAVPKQVEVNVYLVLRLCLLQTVGRLLAPDQNRSPGEQHHHCRSRFHSTSNMLMNPVRRNTVLISSFIFLSSTRLPPALAALRILMRMRKPLDAM